MPHRIEYKRGDTFNLSVSVTESDGTATDMTGWTVACQARTRAGTLISDLTITETDYSLGTFEISCADVSGWPVDDLYSDIQYTDPVGKIISTETFIIRVVRDYTHA